MPSDTSAVSPDTSGWPDTVEILDGNGDSFGFNYAHAVLPMAQMMADEGRWVITIIHPETGAVLHKVTPADRSSTTFKSRYF